MLASMLKRQLKTGMRCSLMLYTATVLQAQGFIPAGLL
jgi:hypothetical protein